MRKLKKLGVPEGAPNFSIVLTKATPGYAGGLKELIAMKKVNEKKPPN